MSDIEFDCPDLMRSMTSGSRSTVSIFSPEYSSSTSLPLGSRTEMPPPNLVPTPLSPWRLHAATKTVLSQALAGRIVSHSSRLLPGPTPEAWGISINSAPLREYVSVIRGMWDSQQSCIPTLAKPRSKTGNSSPLTNTGTSLEPRWVLRYVPMILPSEAMD